MKTRNIVVVMSAIVVAVAGLSIMASMSAAGEKALKVGIVDFDRIVDEYQMKKDRESELKKMQQAKQEDIQKRVKEIEALGEEIRMLDESNPERKAKRWLYAEKRALLEAARQVAGKEFEEKYKEAIEKVYNKILSEIEEFRKQHGYDFIIRVDTKPLKSDSLELMSQHLDRKLILAFSKSFDVTDEVISFLNERYAKGAK